MTGAVNNGQSDSALTVTGGATMSSNGLTNFGTVTVDAGSSYNAGLLSNLSSNPGGTTTLTAGNS